MKPRNHKHADMIRRWLDDESLEVEFLSDGEWVNTYNKPAWFDDFEYRFKPRTIKIGDMEVPEPMRVAPEYGDKYWIASISHSARMADRWDDLATERDWLSRGILHTSFEAATQHSRALVALTEVKQ